MNRITLNRALIALLSASLSGCVHLNLQERGNTNFTRESVTQRQARLKQLTNWDIAGAFSVQYSGSAELANYTWDQKGRNYSIQINSALNIYTVKITGRPGTVSLKESQKRVIYARTPESLLRKRLGWSIPVSNLRFWVRGLPAATRASKTRYDDYGHLMSLSQQGWQVKFSQYVNVKQYDLPRTLTLSGHGLKIKLVIKKWSAF